MLELIKRQNILIFFILISFPACSLFAGNKDSLLNVIQTSKSDSVTILTFRELTYYHLFEDYDLELAIQYLNEGIEISKKSNNHYLSGKMHALKGYVEQFYTNDFAESISNYFIALDEYEIVGAIEDKQAVFLNLGNLYHSYEQFDDAIHFLKKAVENAEISGSEEDWAEAMLNLGVIYNENKEEEKALECLNQARTFYIKTEDSLNIAIIDFSLANRFVYDTSVTEQKTIETIEVYKRVRKIFKEAGLIDYYLGATSNLGIQLKRTGDYVGAKECFLEVEALASEQRNYRLLINVYINLAENAEKQENYKEQASYLKKMNEFNDSLFNEDKAKAISETEIKYETDKINAQNELLQKEGEIKDLELTASKAEARAQEQQKTYLYLGLGLVALFGLFMFNRFRVTKKQKNTIEIQKTDLEKTHHSLAEKNREIMDSIHYAKRIQAAVLPSKSRVDRIFSDGFILYKPKDIVAGDFYWMEEKGELLLYAAADCTGHGVPGAMVSVICNNGLNRSVRERGLTDPGQILDHTREIVTREFEKSDEEVKDGMDISLCVIDKKSKKLFWAGANNPLWIFRDGEVIIYQADSQPIGRYYTTEPFTTHEIDLQSGDTLYTFTDGYADQFGGPKGKKLMSAKMRRFILSIQHFSIQEQKKQLDSFFEEWKKHEEQIDDVCVMGYKVS